MADVQRRKEEGRKGERDGEGLLRICERREGEQAGSNQAVFLCLCVCVSMCLYLCVYVSVSLPPFLSSYRPRGQCPPPHRLPPPPPHALVPSPSIHSIPVMCKGKQSEEH